MENKYQKIEGFDGEFLHPSLDIKNGILILGFRNRLSEKDEQKFFLVARNGNIEHFTSTNFEHDSTQYIIDLGKRMLVPLEERWGLSELNEFLEEYSSLIKDPPPNPSDLFKEILDLLKRFVELEKEVDYILVTSWIIGTYFYPIFPAFPFLNPKGPKGSGKSQFLTILLQLCFNAVKDRPTIAALGDTVDALRGTYLIDQADSLENKGNENLLAILTDSYKKSGGKRRIVEFDKNKQRSVAEYETYGPKAFASIRELHEDLRDRCLIIPIVRSQKNFSDPDDGGEIWKEMRGKLYQLLIDQHTDVMTAYIVQRNEHKQKEGIVGRELELWLPLETILRCIGKQDNTDEAQQRFLSWYNSSKYEPSELEEAIIRVILREINVESLDEITLTPREISEQIDSELFPVKKEPQQRAAMVGWAIKKFNLYSKKTRGNKGQTYFFKKDQIEKIFQSYFSTSDPTHPTDTPENKGADT